MNAKNIKEVIEDSAFIPSLVKLEQVINGIPIGNPMPGLTKIGSGFGYRIDPVHHKTAKHEGLDLVGHYGTPIRATAAGTVQRAGWFNGYGLCVDIMHLYGMVTRYAHLSSAKVRIGQRVSVGQIIGLEGSSGKSTGPHLHYEIRINSVAINPIGFVMKRR